MADVAVIGGSFAGLQAALTLGRARHKVALYDDGAPRNAAAAHVHNFLAQPGPTPFDLLNSSQKMLFQYDVTIVPTRVGEVEATRDGFAVDGHGTAKAVLLATGMRDELPGVEGLEPLWGGRVVACPHCHGWEVRDEALGQLGRRDDPAAGVKRALLLRGWSPDVTLFTDGADLTAADHERLTAAGIVVRPERVDRVAADGDGVTLTLGGGEAVARRALFTVVRQTQASDIAARLGCALDPATGAVVTDPSGRTSVPGVWAAGSTAFPSLLAIGAAGHASTVAVALHADLAGL